MEVWITYTIARHQQFMHVSSLRIWMHEENAKDWIKDNPQYEMKKVLTEDVILRTIK